MRRIRLALATVIVCTGMFALTAVAQAPTRGGTYSGTTSQDRQVRFRVSDDAERVMRFRLRRDFECTRGPRRSSLTGLFAQIRPLPISSEGTFHAHRLVTGGGNGPIRRGVVCLRGRFGPGARTVRGRLRERVRLRDGSYCRTGIVRFRAHVHRRAR